MYSHSGATLSKMLECLIAKCKFAIGFCHSKNRTNVRSKLLLLRHLPNLVGHCPMSDSNLQPCELMNNHGKSVTVITFNIRNEYTVLGPVVQRWVSANPGLKFNLLF